ncbi:polysaccharide pyruvyl transferase family protein [Pseudonocardia lutea]|uniref:Polysaccharide pyruvyl transferase family protein n=1 Tax=Pseudonocardia lutea TaxID=2172015 RepID=A0ABW1I485_9PSEU
MLHILAGGWGYPNLGDEAILTGYRDFFASQRIDALVTSANPERTASAIGVPRHDLGVEGSALTGHSTGSMILGGGGYLNASWIPEIHRKLKRLIADRRSRPLVGHSIEVRGVEDPRFRRKLARLLSEEARISVRDEQSADALSRIGHNVDVLPDAISLLYPAVNKFAGHISYVTGRVVLNLLDISRRPDSTESLFPVDRWNDFASQLISRLGSKCIVMTVGDGDEKFLLSLPPVDVIKPKTVTEMISVLASASGVISVRMHPALIASMIGRPTLSIPYCGKVRPTLKKLRLDELLVQSADVDEALARLTDERSFDEAWSAAHAECASWLRDLVGSDQSPRADAR